MTTEFNSNINFGAIPNTSAQKNIDQHETVNVENTKVGEDKLNEVPVGQNAIAGKSQVKADNIASDLLTFKANPQVVAMADKIFDKAYASLTAKKDPEAYEKACLIASQYVVECTK